MAEKECYGFKMDPSYYEVIRPLPDDQRLAMLDAIMDYAFMGTEPNGLSPVLNGYFTLIRPNIDKSVRLALIERFPAVCSAHACMSWRHDLAWERHLLSFLTSTNPNLYIKSPQSSF